MKVSLWSLWRIAGAGFASANVSHGLFIFEAWLQFGQESQRSRGRNRQPWQAAGGVLLRVTPSSATLEDNACMHVHTCILIVCRRSLACYCLMFIFQSLHFFLSSSLLFYHPRKMFADVLITPSRNVKKKTKPCGHRNQKIIKAVNNLNKELFPNYYPVEVHSGRHMNGSPHTESTCIC